MPSDLEKICKKAIEQGQNIDLTGCYYGKDFGTERFFTEPSAYYYFLAGFVRSLRLTHILELGTHYGGSIMSMSKGLHEQDLLKSRLVTVDEFYTNPEGFKNYPNIQRVLGDLLEENTLHKIVEIFNGSIDLLFIDATHTYEATKNSIALYAKRLKPKYIILDDILLNDPMKKLWLEIKQEFGIKAFDATEISRRGARVGFGVVQYHL